MNSTSALLLARRVRDHIDGDGGRQDRHGETDLGQRDIRRSGPDGHDDRGREGNERGHHGQFTARIAERPEGDDEPSV